jgi:TRAP-type C4-dicarboxylate transport system substrate-binding protein
MTIGLRVLLAALAVLTAWPSAASAQTKLKWAHVYEVAEPYHTQAVWAGEEIKKRSNGKYQIDVFPASQLGNENQRGGRAWHRGHDLHWRIVAGAIHKPIQPLARRSCCAIYHWKAYRESQLFRDIAKGYEDKTTLTYYGQRMVTANRRSKTQDMKGMKPRVPPALFLMFTKSVGANATIAFAEVYLACSRAS